MCKREIHVLANALATFITTPSVLRNYFLLKSHDIRHILSVRMYIDAIILVLTERIKYIF
jgi:hypothetical protein